MRFGDVRSLASGCTLRNFQQLAHKPDSPGQSHAKLPVVGNNTGDVVLIRQSRTIPASSHSCLGDSACKWSRIAPMVVFRLAGPPSFLGNQLQRGDGSVPNLLRPLPLFVVLKVPLRRLQQIPHVLRFPLVNIMPPCQYPAFAYSTPLPRPPPVPVHRRRRHRPTPHRPGRLRPPLVARLRRCIRLG